MTYQFISTFNDKFISKVLLCIKNKIKTKKLEIQMLLFENSFLVNSFLVIYGGGGNFSWESGLVPYPPGLAHCPSNKSRD